EGSAVRWGALAGLIAAPAGDRAVHPHRATVTPPRGHLGEVSGGRFSLAKVVPSPARQGTIHTERAAVGFARGDLHEVGACGRRCPIRAGVAPAGESSHPSGGGTRGRSPRSPA